MKIDEAMEIIMQVAYDGEFPNNSNEAFGIACKCIEKQIPKEIRQEIDGGRLERYCPNNCQITGATMHTNIKYCPYCGQAIKWE